MVDLREAKTIMRYTMVLDVGMVFASVDCGGLRGVVMMLVGSMVK